MIYLIDGYNLLFKFFHNEKKIEVQREAIIDLLKEKSSLLKINIHLIFDGYKQNSELSNKRYFDKLKVVYTPKGQTADDYILEQIFLSKTPQEIVVITSDNHLKIKAKEMKAQVKSINAFIDWLSKKESQMKMKKESEEKNYLDTKKNIERLLKIFEEKMNDESDDWN